MIDLVCNHHLLNHIRTNLEQFNPRVDNHGNHSRAAVAVTIVDTRHHPDIDGVPFSSAMADHAALVLTRRAVTLRHHPGQWALPGGRMESGERPQETVLRELEEEVGLRLGEERIIGRLDDYSTRSGFTITPLVVWGGLDVSLAANPVEVASIHRIPLAEFLREDAPSFQTIPESEHPVLFMPVGSSCIAAPTAAVIYQFREVALLGRDRRVAHYEQPYFAWRCFL
jgi:8-oxo-dGTP pyrophosphatase MutT (NUDIX family)